MNNKGFTLVELLAVIVILSTIALVAVSSVTNSLYRRDVQDCKEQRELARNAAKIYFSLEDSQDDVSIETLIDKKYLESSRFPKDGNRYGKLGKNSKVNSNYVYSNNGDDSVCPSSID